MASFFNDSLRQIPTTETTVVTSTSDSTIVLSILIANREGVSAADITCAHKDASDVIQNYLAFTIVVPADANVDLIGNKYILPSGEKLVLSASTSGILDAAVSYVTV
jgi:hypothetical protein